MLSPKIWGITSTSMNIHFSNALFSMLTLPRWVKFFKQHLKTTLTSLRIVAKMTSMKSMMFYISRQISWCQAIIREIILSNLTLQQVMSSWAIWFSFSGTQILKLSQQHSLQVTVLTPSQMNTLTMKSRSTYVTPILFMPMELSFLNSTMLLCSPNNIFMFLLVKHLMSLVQTVPQSFSPLKLLLVSLLKSWWSSSFISHRGRLCTVLSLSI